MQKAPLVFDELVSFELSRTTTAFRNSLERQMAKLDLHSGQISVLRELWEKDGQRQVDIAGRLNLAAPTVNKIVVGLTKINLVVRERLDNDARSTRIFLTAKGLDYKEEVEEQWSDLETTCRSAITEAEKYMLIDMLARIRAKLTGIEIMEED
jgi:DNA-binding MarR family transcriptional regulator